MTQTDRSQQSDGDTFGVVRSQRRRTVLRYLAGESTPVDLATLVEHVAGDADESTADSDDRQQLRLSLTHVHLPKLADAGLVHYDRQDGRVSLADAAESRLTEACRDLHGVVAAVSADADGG